MITPLHSSASFRAMSFNWNDSGATTKCVEKHMFIVCMDGRGLMRDRKGDTAQAIYVDSDYSAVAGCHLNPGLKKGF